MFNIETEATLAMKQNVYLVFPNMNILLHGHWQYRNEISNYNICENSKKLIHLNISCWFLHIFISVLCAWKCQGEQIISNQIFTNSCNILIMHYLSFKCNSWITGVCLSFYFSHIFSISEIIWSLRLFLSFYSSHIFSILEIINYMISQIISQISRSSGSHGRFSVAKATLQSPMSVHLSVCLSAKPLNSLKSSSFIIRHSSFIILHYPSFISRLLSFSACYWENC